MTIGRPYVSPRRRLGQHFLRDEQVLRCIADAAQLENNDTVVEIGPGTGALTRQLLMRAGRVVAVELDDRFRPYLELLALDWPSLIVVWGNFMKLNWANLPLRDPVKVVANIPYYITTPILLKLLQVPSIEVLPLRAVKPLASCLVVMVQAEVADRMEASPGSKAYGSLSILMQYAASVERVLSVPASAFTPRPEVDSAVLRLIPRSTPCVDLAAPKVFFRVVRGAFGQRRKTLCNALMAAGFTKDELLAALNTAELDPMRRGENLSIAEFARLANALG